MKIYNKYLQKCEGCTHFYDILHIINIIIISSSISINII